MSLLIPVQMQHLCMTFCPVLCCHLLLQSWWVWDDLEITDLWYNCFHDNATNAWLCAATRENGKLVKYIFLCISA